MSVIYIECTTQVTFVVLGFATMIAVQLIENYTTGHTAVTGTGVSTTPVNSSKVVHQDKDGKCGLNTYDIAARNESIDGVEGG